MSRQLNASPTAKEKLQFAPLNALAGSFLARQAFKCIMYKYTGEATPADPKPSQFFGPKTRGTRPDLMKTTSARQKALAKLKRADRNVLDASQLLKERREQKARPSGPSEARKPKSKKLQHIERPRARYVCTVCGCTYCSNNCIVTP